jgi:hypothetical protein
MRELVGEPVPASRPLNGTSETAAQQRVRIEAARAGWRVWRNNVGALQDPKSKRWIRFGLANESEAMNSRIKSSDLIGIEPLLIGPEHIGQTVGRFVSIEVKEVGWRPSGRGREVQQAVWIALIKQFGGRAFFSTGGIEE